jgi:hypothetical protein
MLVFTFIIIIIIILLSILILVLAVPFEYSVSGCNYEKYCFEAELSWLFRSTRFIFLKEEGKPKGFWFRIFGFDRSLKGTRNDKYKKQKKNKRKDSQYSVSDFLSVKLLKEAADFITMFVKHIRPRIFQLSGKFGFEDPFETGIILATLNVFGIDYNCSVNLHPVFDEEVLEGSFIVKGRIVLAYLLFILVKLLLSRSGRRIIFKRRPKKAGIKYNIKREERFV